MAEPILSIEDLRVYYDTLLGPVRAVDGVTLEVPRGEWVSIVGESGSGKSTLAYAIMRLIPPPGRIAGGRIVFEGTDLTSLSGEEMRRVRGRRIGMVFQDPMASLDPVRRVGDQIGDVYLEHGVASDRREARRLAGEALEMVGLPASWVDRYPHQLSGGQRQRVLIAAAVALKPSLLIADEPTTALDVIVQDKIMDLIEDLKRELRMTVVLITHDIALAAERSTRIAVMYAGKLVEYGPVDAVVEDPLHPYTRGLIESAPDLWGEKRLRGIPGYPPDLRRPPSGCRFHPRCPLAVERCRSEEPRPLRLEGGRLVACHRALEGR
ncbi:MAG: ABC transporter ATP-binding protein [Desulfurococcales archaeon]|nr:ABC transporter ATP-binding protein [Desulfurococcales archaeon]